MGGALSANNLVIVTAFRHLLAQQAVIVVALVAVSLLAWGARRILKARGTLPGAMAEPPGRKVLRIGLAGLWIVDGFLQVQQSMPVGLPTQVVSPAAATSPAWVRHLVDDGVLIWTRHPTSAAASVVWIEVGIGLLLLLAPRGLLSELGGVASVGWGLVVWTFGEAFGGIFGSGATWMFGAPGAALLYAVAGLLIALPEQSWATPVLGRRLFAATGAFLVGMAVLQAWPGRGFWPGRGGNGVAAMVNAMAQTPQPHALASILRSFASLDTRHGWAVNLVVVASLAGVGVACITRGRRWALAAVLAGSLLCLADWILVQDLGVLGGVGTDPNSMIPTALLLVAGYIALTRGVPSGAAKPAVVPVRPADSVPMARPGTRRPPLSALLGPTAAVGALGVILLGAAPMAVASTDRHTDAIVSEALNGQPQRVDSSAPAFALTDQRGRDVSLAGLRGRTIALTFLDPVCTSDCPLIAQEFRQVDAGLGAAASGRTAFVAVVANPVYRAPVFARAFDAQEHLADIPNWYFLTGSLAQLSHVWNAYGIEVQVLGAGGMVAHADTAFVIGPGGRLREVLGADPGDGVATASSFATVLTAGMRAVMGS